MAGTLTCRVVPVEDLPNRLPAEHTNWLVMQVLINGEWLDYASIKDTDDLTAAARKLRTKPSEFRVWGRGY
jgi:hypothetical protein